MSKVVTAFTFVFAGIALQACATFEYAKPVAGFASAVGAANTQFEESQAAIEKTHFEKTRAYALAHPRSINLYSDDDCNPGRASDPEKNRCRLVVRYTVTKRDGTKLPIEEPLSYTDSHLDLRPLSRSLAEYAKDLTKIVEADVAADVASAVSDAKAQVDKLGASVETYRKQNGNEHSQVGTRVAAGSGAIAELLGYGLTKYLEDMKLEALRAATQEMNPNVREAAAALASVGDAELRTKRSRLQREYDKADADHVTAAQGDAPPEDRARALDAWIAAAQGLDAAKQAQAAAVYEALSRSHNELMILLRDGNVNSSSFWAQIGSALDEISKVADIAQKFKIARKVTSDEDAKNAVEKNEGE